MLPYNGDLIIKDEDGARIPVSDCKLQPLNLLIPGSAPIMVPKDKAWPGARKKEAIKPRVPPSATNSYDAGEEEAPDEEPVAIKAKSRRASKAKASSKTDTKVKTDKKLVESCNKATKLGKLATEAKQRKKFEEQVKEQERYIAKLKAKYAANKQKYGGKSHNEMNESDHEPEDTATSSSMAGNVSTASDASGSGEQSGASEQVRQLIKSLRIKAAGTEDAEFNPSEDSQLLARKGNGETWAMIAKYMGRSKKQLQKRHKELMALGKTAETAGTSGPGESTEAATDTDKDAPADAFGGLFDLGGLQAKLEATAADQARAEKKGANSDEKDAVEAPRGSPVGILKTDGGGKKKDKKKPKPAQTPPPAAAGGESGYESGSDDVSAKVLIGTYGRQLLTDKSTIPEADDKFDEDDCILMGLADARRKADRWKQIQADFANLTGRMVPVEVLKYKFGVGDKPEDY